MSWISKDLTLDLIAIGIHSLNKIYERIKAEPDTAGEWPQTEAATPEVTQAPDPAPATQHEPQANPEPEPAPEPEPQVDVEALHTQAQTILRTIAQTRGTDWITGTLFPHFGITSLTELPAEKLPELVDMADKHLQEAAK